MKRVFTFILMFLLIFSNIYSNDSFAALPAGVEKDPGNSNGYRLTHMPSMKNWGNPGGSYTAQGNTTKIAGAGFVGESNDSGGNDSSPTDESPAGVGPNLVPLDVHSVNNTIEDSYYRPKIEDLEFDVEKVALDGMLDTELRVNSYDVDYTEVKKPQSSRALEILGYDFLLTSEKYEGGKYTPTKINSSSITGYELIMDIYKALDMDAYDIDVKYATNDEGLDGFDANIFVSRTNKENYWKLYENDCPVNYLFNPSAVMTPKDAIVIISQMMDFYGEPVISDKEQYTLLQYYGKDVPVDLSDNYRKAWSYLKCRGILNSKLDYNKPLKLNDLLDILMCVKDEDSRSNFKQLTITAPLDDTLVDNGYYPRDVNLVGTEDLDPELEFDYSTATNIDFLVEVNDSMLFKKKSTNEVNTSIFVSAEGKYYSKPIPGSSFLGIVNNKYYHFSVPYSATTSLQKIYINSNSANDYPLLYEISPNGGVYSGGTVSTDGIVTFKDVTSFDKTLPNTQYVDISRKGAKISILWNILGIDSVFADNNYSGVTATLTYNPKKLKDPKASAELLISKGYTVDTGTNYSKFVVKVPYTGNYTNNISKKVSALLVTKYDENLASGSHRAILSLQGEGLLLPFDTVSTNDTATLSKVKILLAHYEKHINDTQDSIVFYDTKGNIIIANNKTKTIQIGSEYIQLDAAVPIYTFIDEKLYIDFRIIYGLANSAFTITPDGTGSTTVKLYPSVLGVANGAANDVGMNKVGNYFVNNHAKFLMKYTNEDKKLVPSAKTTILVDAQGNSYLPMSAPNPFGSYVFYNGYNHSSGLEEAYLVNYYIKDALNDGSFIKNESKALTDLFYNYSLDIQEKYTPWIKKINTNDTYFTNIPGFGYCYKLPKAQNEADVSTYTSSYVSGGIPLPFVRDSAGYVRCLNYNFYGDKTKYSAAQAPGSSGNIIPAPVGVRVFHEDSAFFPTVKNYSNGLNREVRDGTNKEVWVGTEKVNTHEKLALSDKSITSILCLGSDKITIISMGKASINGEGTRAEVMYQILPFPVTITLNQEKLDELDSIQKRLLEMQNFFDKFKDVSLKDALRMANNFLDFAYLFATRVIPIIIMGALTILLLITFIDDMKIVQLFCDRFIDPVKILTAGHFNIHTLNNRYMVISLIAALALMGIIQNGNIEKILVFGAKTYYVIRSLFPY